MLRTVVLVYVFLCQYSKCLVVRPSDLLKEICMLYKESCNNTICSYSSTQYPLPFFTPFKKLKHKLHFFVKSINEHYLVKTTKKNYKCTTYRTRKP